MGESEYSNRRKQKEKKNDKEDRLSSLPDELIYHIFSFLDMKEVVTTCVLSRNWQYLYMSTPTLIFDYDDIVCDFRCCGCGFTSCECEACLLEGYEFLCFVDKILTLRRSKIVKFKLNFVYIVHPADIYKWIDVALARRVRDVDISIAVDETLILPDPLFTANLKVLKLSCDAKVPNSIVAAVSIKHLDLQCVELPDGNTDRELILNFPVLESLRLVRCYVGHLELISISTPVLKSLEFNRLYVGDSSSCIVKTCTPDLKFLRVYECIDYADFLTASVNYCMDNFSSLESAEIFFRFYNDKLVEECCKRWIKAVSWIYNVQALKLLVSSVQFFIDNAVLLERLSGVFCNLKHVMLDMDGDEFFHVKAMLKFLEKAPQIETLALLGRDPSWYNMPGAFEEEEWTEEEWTNEVKWVESLPLFNHMVSFEIRNFSGLNFEMKFLEFVLEKAIVLKKLIIETKKEWLQGKPKEKILSFPRASSSVSILFQITDLSAEELQSRRHYKIV